MHELINKYLQFLAITDSTKELYTQELRLFFNFIQKNPLEIAKEDVLKYLTHLYNKPLEPSTISKKRVIIKSFFTWLEDEGKISKNPFYKLKFKLKKNRKIPKILTKEEISNLLINRRNATRMTFRQLRSECIIRLFLATGIRQQELINAEIQDCNLENKTLVIRKTKTKKEIEVNLDKSTAWWLEKYFKERNKHATHYRNIFIDSFGNPLERKKIYEIVVYRFKKIGIKGRYKKSKRPTAHWHTMGKGLGSHTFRRTYATRLLQNGADLRTVQLLLGHEDIKTTARYLFPDKEHIREVYNKTNIIDKIESRPKRKKRKTAQPETPNQTETKPQFDEDLL